MEDVVINIKGYEVIISACDVERVKAHGWYKNTSKKFKGGPYFAYRSPGDGKNISLHRFIMNCPPDMYVDHINCNTLDNRRSNLRICNRAENSKNRRKNKNSTSGYKGVFWDKNFLEWAAYICVNRKRIYLGRFNNPEKAYEAYVAASQKYHGEFGCIG